MPIKHWLIAAAAALALIAPAARSRAQDVVFSAFPNGAEETAALPGQLVSSPEVVASEPLAAEPVVQPVAQPMASYPVSLCIPNLAPGWQFWGGVLLLKPSAQNLGYGIWTMEKNLAVANPIVQPYWTTESVVPTFQAGFELGTGYTFANSGRDFQVNWQHLRTSNSTSAGVTNTDGQWISPFSQTGPPTAADFQDMYVLSGVNHLHSATAQANFAYDQVNFDFGQYFNVGSSLMLRLFGGLSYATMKDQVLSNFYGDPPDPNAPFPLNTPLRISLNNTSHFSGAGPRFGLDGRYLTCCGLRFTGQVAGAVYAGRTQPAQYSFRATSPELAAVGITENVEGIYSSPYTHVVFGTNAKLGVGYSRAFSSGAIFTFDVGYLAALFTQPFSGYETNHNIIGVQTGSLSTGSVRHTISDFTLNGAYFNAGLTW